MDSADEYSIKAQRKSGIEIDSNTKNCICRNLTESIDELFSIVGREHEIEWMCNKLLCKLKPNILLVGEPGVGKTALVEGLAKFSKESDDYRVNKFQFMEFSAGSLISGTSYRGDFEKRIMDLVKVLSTHESIVLFIDEAHTLAMTGDVHGGGVDALNLLKPYLTSGRIKCILATTPSEMKFLANDKAFMRRFGILQLHPLSQEEIQMALRFKGKHLCQFHGIEFDNLYFDFIEENFIKSNLGLDSALDFLDEILAGYSLDQGLSIQELMKSRFSKFMTTRRFLDEFEFIHQAGN